MPGQAKLEMIVEKMPVVLVETSNIQWIRWLGMDIIGDQVGKMIDLMFRHGTENSFILL